MAPPDFPPGGYLADYVGFWVIWLAILAGTFVFFRRARGNESRTRLVVGNLLVLASLGWTALLVAETYLRYVYDDTDQHALTLTNWSWFGRHMRPNSRQFRDREWPAAKPPGVLRVACFGDS